MTSRVSAMQVTTHRDGLHVRFPYSAALVARIKRIHDATWDKARRVWVVPAAQADRLMEEFPEAAFDYGAFCAAADAHEERLHYFCDMLCAFDIRLEVDEDGTVRGVGENCSDTLQAEIAKRSDALRRRMGEGAR